MDKSPFDRLPRELRDEIWRLALHVSDGIPLQVTTNDNDDTIVRAAAELRAEHPLALTRSCEQIHTETQGMFYEVNTFRFPVDLEPEPSDEEEEGSASLVASTFSSFSLDAPENALDLSADQDILRNSIGDLNRRANGAVAEVELDDGTWYYLTEVEMADAGVMFDESTIMRTLAKALLTARFKMSLLLRDHDIPLFFCVTVQAQRGDYAEVISGSLPLSSLPIPVPMVENVARPYFRQLSDDDMAQEMRMGRYGTLRECRRRLGKLTEMLNQLAGWAPDSDEEVDGVDDGGDGVHQRV